ncbi:unnamed protein product, partial [Prorocentrum cordatum]
MTAHVPPSRAASLSRAARRRARARCTAARYAQAAAGAIVALLQPRGPDTPAVDRAPRMGALETLTSLSAAARANLAAQRIRTAATVRTTIAVKCVTESVMSFLLEVQLMILRPFIDATKCAHNMVVVLVSTPFMDLLMALLLAQLLGRVGEFLARDLGMAFLGHSLDLLGASSRLGLNTLFEMPSLVESLGLAGVSFVLGRGMVLFARSSDLEGAYSRLGQLAREGLKVLSGGAASHVEAYRTALAHGAAAETTSGDDLFSDMAYKW